MTGRPVAALTDSVARQILAHHAGRPETIAIELADELLALGRWKSNTCAPLLRAYELARDNTSHPAEAARDRVIVAALAAYDGSTYRLLTALADHLQLSLAYIDRETVEAHLERALSDAEWAATNEQFTALDFDEHVGDHGTFRTDWIETVLDKAGVPGYGYTTDGTRARGVPDGGGAAA
ncbi:MAG: hypothetical protein J0H43_00015 [Actinobacteria bacterium]|nr:hypothetical protein [Actinomycetota bacterium]